MPFISVLITAYNRENYIEEAIRSVLDSNYKDYELIVLDDCSTDNTYRIIQEMGRENPQIRIYKNEKNLGQFPTRNKIASLAKGSYLKYLDSDDVMEPDCLTIMATAARKYPDAAIIGESNILPLQPRMNTKYLTSREAFLGNYCLGNNILNTGPSACMFKKENFDRVGGYTNDYKVISDTQLMFKLAFYNPIVAVPHKLIFWREHEGQAIRGNDNWVFNVTERFRLNMEVLSYESLPVSTSEVEIIKRNVKSLFIRRLVQRAFKQKSLKEANMVLKIDSFTMKDLILAGRKNKKITA